jgi:hypothetical protein
VAVEAEAKQKDMNLFPFLSRCWGRFEENLGSPGHIIASKHLHENKTRANNENTLNTQRI